MSSKLQSFRRNLESLNKEFRFLMILSEYRLSTRSSRRLSRLKRSLGNRPWQRMTLVHALQKSVSFHYGTNL
jgi:hypothetical protein